MPDTLLGNFSETIPTRRTSEPTATLDARRIEEWNVRIDWQLIEWGSRPDFFVAEDFEPPSATAIGVATQVAAWMRDRGMKPPDRVAPSGDGGIVFERRWKGGCARIEIEAEGAVWAVALENSKLVYRNRWK